MADTPVVIISENSAGIKAELIACTVSQTTGITIEKDGGVSLRFTPESVQITTELTLRPYDAVE